MFLSSLSFKLNFYFFLSILDLGGGETPSNGAFGSFFFGNGGSPINKEQVHNRKSN